MNNLNPTNYILSREPVQSSANFFGREKELILVQDYIQMSHPQSVCIIGEPRIGKSSFLRALHSGFQRASPSFYHVWVDLFEILDRDSDLVWEGIFNGVVDEIDSSDQDFAAFFRSNEDFEEMDSNFRKINFILEELANRSVKVILYFDNADILFNLFSLDDFIRLRSLDGNDNFAVVMTTSKPIADLFKSRFPEIEVSPYTNIYIDYKLGLLDHISVGELIRSAADRLDINVNDHCVKIIINEVGRHPALIKIACEYMFRYLREEETFCDEDDRLMDLLTEIRFDSQVSWLYRTLIDRREDYEKDILKRIVLDEPLSGNLTPRSLRNIGLLVLVDRKYQLFSDGFLYWAIRLLEIEKKSNVVAPKRDSELLRYSLGRSVIIKEGEEIVLTKLENRLMQYLSSRQGEICSDNKIFENVWDGRGNISVVEKAINRLRGKLETGSPPKYIVTYRGQGYMLENVEIIE